MVGQTEHQAQLLVMILALAQLKKKCKLNIYTDSDYIAIGLTNWIKGWQENNWITAKGADVANKDLWIQMLELLNGNEYELHYKEPHSYREWMESEIKKYSGRN